MIFDYPSHARQRRHGPKGYVDYQSFKPWLRDEFTFRCVYCLCREPWFPDGDGSFSVDHLVPQSVAPERACDYENLVYACRQCNSVKRATTGVPDPCADPYGLHLEVLADGTVQGLTPQGKLLIRFCRLDRPRLNEFRHGILELFRDLQNHNGQEAAELRRRFFGLPPNLPTLRNLKPPGGNDRFEGVEKGPTA